ncbi:UDP-N-acetyl glucosamine 2-epimerase [Microbulbifer sp. YPW16]|nr:UDP-N-acetyl glucosamine 2-epimerase [Microbulbifer sp. YPW16]
MSEILTNFGLPEPDFYLYRGRDITSISSMLFWSVRVLVFSVLNNKKVFGSGSSKQDIVLVHGDTVSTLVGALMGRLAGMHVGHVESGLRSFDYFNPFPEELTRVAVFRLANVFFCQDEKAIANLSGVKGEKVNLFGNTLYDSLASVSDSENDSLSAEFADGAFGIVTLHRYENIGSLASLERVVRLVEVIARKHRLLFVMHKPTEKALKKFGLLDRVKANKNIKIIPRLDYFRFIRLMKAAEFVVSDGGSNQEECSYMGKPLLLLRKATERQEGIGQNCILSCYVESVVEDFCKNYKDYRRPELQSGPSPSEVVANALSTY